jgi:hypothetical protein
VRVGDFGASDAYVGLYELEIPAGLAPSSVPIEIRFRTIDGVEEHVVSQAPAFGHDAEGAYAIVDAREHGLYRAATLGYAAIGLREAALADERGDTAGSEGWLRSTLVAVEAAQRQLAQHDATRAATLDEPVALLRRSHDAVLARLPTNEVRASAQPTAPVLVLQPSPQVITPAPGASVVPIVPGAPTQMNVAVSVGATPGSSNELEPGSARFADWR